MSNIERFTNNFRIIIASLPYRKNCVCEIYYNQEQWVEISQEGAEVIIQFFAPMSKEYWEFPLETALEVLQKAKQRFLEK